MRRLLNLRTITIAYFLFLVLGTVIPLGSIAPDLDNNYVLHIRLDYLLHLIFYSPLPILLWLQFRKASRERQAPLGHRIGFWFLLALVSLAITAAFEFIQIVIPYRAFNINDLVANGVGAMMGLILMKVFWKPLRKI